ncbi:hypothetical protein CSUB01_09886 [Colletotrichum sublineola]|uniref:Yos1-like protein n=1 Tax=Colletotrichum sublineola TaxID=1173701 RepID=A0A066XMZ6_COLSU|nr:hypothetical protein CSUB01_09886 [Colletotrichum sublineola]
MFILGNFLYIAVLLINAIAILSEDRFLARSMDSSPPPSLIRLLTPWIYDLAADGGPAAWFNLSPSSYDPSFGASTDASIKAKIINLIASVRTLMRSTALSRERAASQLLFPLNFVLTVFHAVPLIGINTIIILYELILG